MQTCPGTSEPGGKCRYRYSCPDHLIRSGMDEQLQDHAMPGEEVPDNRDRENRRSVPG
jgi:hypothetical protein